MNMIAAYNQTSGHGLVQTVQSISKVDTVLHSSNE